MDNLTPDQIQAMIAMLQKMLPAETSSNSDEEENDDHFVETKKTNSFQRNETKNTRKKAKNKFADMPEMNMHKEDREIDNKLCIQPPVPRARPFNYVNPICRGCGKKEKVNPKLVHESIDRYKCNKCSSSSG